MSSFKFIEIFIYVVILTACRDVLASIYSTNSLLECSVFFYIEGNAVLISFSFLAFEPLNSNLSIFVFHFHWHIPFAGSSDTSCKVEVRFLCWINSKYCTTVTTLHSPCFHKNTEIQTVLSCNTRFVKMHSFCFEGVEQMVIFFNHYS